MPDEAKPEAAPAAPAKKGGLLPTLTLFLVLVNLGGTGFLALRAMKHVSAEGGAGRDAGVAEAKPGPIVPLESFVVNLNESGSSRYLKATMEIQVHDESAAKRLEHDKRAVRDGLLRYLSGLSVQDTLGEENKGKIQQQVVSRLEKVLGNDAVQQIFFTEFVVQ